MSLSIGMLGVGAWGAALAHVVRSAGHAVHVWSRGSTLEPLRGSQGLIMAVPAQALREILSGLKSIVTNSGKGLPLIIGAKVIEQGTGLFKNEVVAEVLPEADQRPCGRLWMPFTPSLTRAPRQRKKSPGFSPRPRGPEIKQG